MSRQQKRIAAALARFEHSDRAAFGAYTIVLTGAPFIATIGGKITVFDARLNEVFTTRTKGGAELGERALLRALNWIANQRRSNRIWTIRQQFARHAQNWIAAHPEIPQEEVEAIVVDRLRELGLADDEKHQTIHYIPDYRRGLRIWRSCLAVIRQVLPVVN